VYHILKVLLVSWYVSVNNKISIKKACSFGKSSDNNRIIKLDYKQKQKQKTNKSDTVMNTNTNTVNTTSTEAKRSATIEKNRAARIEERGFSLPLVLTCTVTGKQVKYTSPAYISKVVAKHGSLEALMKNFVSREGRRNGKA